MSAMKWKRKPKRKYSGIGKDRTKMVSQHGKGMQEIMQNNVTVMLEGRYLEQKGEPHDDTM